MHKFGCLDIHLRTGRQRGGKKDEELHENVLYTALQHMRWVIIDEIENVSVEVLAALQKQVADSSRTRGNPWSRSAVPPHEKHLFGGLNLLLIGDLWQIPPVRALSIADNPFVKHRANHQRILDMFWTSDESFSLTHKFNLTASHRCRDERAA